MQLAAFELVQDNVEELPATTDCGLAVRFTAGDVPDTIVIATVSDIGPLVASQVSAKLASAVSGPTTSDPVAGRDPAQPLLAVQFDTDVPDQVKVTVPPLVIADAEADRTRLAGGGADSDDVPPELPQPAISKTQLIANKLREVKANSIRLSEWYIFKSTLVGK